jgi:hypothetical protein
VVLVVDEEAKPAANHQGASLSSQSANESRTALDHKDIKLFPSPEGQVSVVWTDELVRDFRMVLLFSLIYHRLSIFQDNKLISAYKARKGADWSAIATDVGVSEENCVARCAEKVAVCSNWSWSPETVSRKQNSDQNSH